MPKVLERTPILISALFLMGVYAPSSIDGVYSEALWIIYLIVAAMLFTAMLLRPHGIANEWTCVNSLVIVASLIGSTILSPFPDYRWGGLLPYLVLALLLTVDVQKLDGGARFQTVFAIASAVNIIWGVSMCERSTYSSGCESIPPDAELWAQFQLNSRMVGLEFRFQVSVRD